MSERLTASLEDGTLEKLRTLAGGERKVGAYLSSVVSWLWANKDKLDAYSPSSINVEKGEEIERRIDRLYLEFSELQRKIDGIANATLEEIATLSEDEKAAIRQRLLATPQQDSSQNDA